MSADPSEAVEEVRSELLELAMTLLYLICRTEGGEIPEGIPDSSREMGERLWKTIAELADRAAARRQEGVGRDTQALVERLLAQHVDQHHRTQVPPGSTPHLDDELPPRRRPGETEDVDPPGPAPMKDLSAPLGEPTWIGRRISEMTDLELEAMEAYVQTLVNMLYRDSGEGFRQLSNIIRRLERYHEVTVEACQRETRGRYLFGQNIVWASLNGVGLDNESNGYIVEQMLDGDGDLVRLRCRFLRQLGIEVDESKKTVDGDERIIMALPDPPGILDLSTMDDAPTGAATADTAGGPTTPATPPAPPVTTVRPPAKQTPRLPGIIGLLIGAGCRGLGNFLRRIGR